MKFLSSEILTSTSCNFYNRGGDTRGGQNRNFIVTVGHQSLSFPSSKRSVSSGRYGTKKILVRKGTKSQYTYSELNDSKSLDKYNYSFLSIVTETVYLLYLLLYNVKREL